MSRRVLIPHGFGRDFWDTWDFPERIVDQQFGLGLPVDAILDTASVLPALYALQCPAIRRSGGNRGRSGQVAVGGGDEKGYSSVRNDDTQFQVRMDCSHFSPEELSVKLVDDSLVVTGKHEERKDEHGYISREFTRRYLLPKDVQLDQIKSSLSADGTLTLTVPKKVPEAVEGSERVIPITMAATNEAVTPAPAPESEKKSE